MRSTSWPMRSKAPLMKTGTPDQLRTSFGSSAVAKAIFIDPAYPRSHPAITNPGDLVHRDDGLGTGPGLDPHEVPARGHQPVESFGHVERAHRRVGVRIA